LLLAYGLTMFYVSGAIVFIELVLVVILSSYWVTQIDLNHDDKNIILLYVMAGFIIYNLLALYFLVKTFSNFLIKKNLKGVDALKWFLLIYLILLGFIWIGVMFRVVLRYNVLFAFLSFSLIYLLLLLYKVKADIE
jgi:hypothetical protein